MNENQKPRTYINGVFIQDKVFPDGGYILKMSILPDKFNESFKGLKPDKHGFIRLVIAKSKTPKPNSSHYLYLDTFEPTKKNVQTVSNKTEIKEAKKAENIAEEELI